MNKLQEKNENQTYNYGCLMVEFEIPNWEKWVKKLVDPKDVYNNDDNEFGLETEPHTTILYGFKNKNLLYTELMPYLMPSHYIKVKFNNISIFEAEEYDVLKFSCESKALDVLHKTTKHYFENVWEWPNYQPHVTIAYLKKGKSKKYIKDPLSSKFTLVPSGYLYSNSEGEKFQFDVEEIPGANDSNVVM